MTAPREFLLVDGHSIIFAWPELRALQERRRAAAREKLVGELTRYQDASDVRVVVVFDGSGAKTTQEKEDIQIFYSRSGQTADQVIERLVARYAQQHRLTVATADRLEQQTAESFGADWITPDTLRARMETAEADLTRRLKKFRS